MILRLFAIILLPIYAVTMLIVTILSIFLWIYNKKFVMDYETPQKIDKLYWKIFL